MIACYQVGVDLKLKIRELRTSQGLTLADVASRIGVSVPHLSEVERGKKNINNHLLVRLAAALGVQPGDLIAGQEQNAHSGVSDLLAAVDGLSPADLDRVRAFALALRQST